MRSYSEDGIQEAINNLHCISLPSEEIVKMLEQIYAATEANGVEYHFVVGTGNISSEVRGGEAGEVSFEVRLDGMNEIRAAGEQILYDVHSHPALTELSLLGHYEDTATNSENDIKVHCGSQPNIILGYYKELNADGLLRERLVNFYNSEGLLFNITVR